MGALDGHTILRFTHSYDEAGGVEQYLNNLNSILLEHNRMTIIQLYLPNESSLFSEIEGMINAMDLKDCVRFVGKLSQTELKDNYQQSEIVSYPNLGSNFRKPLAATRTIPTRR